MQPGVLSFVIFFLRLRHCNLILGIFVGHKMPLLELFCRLNCLRLVGQQAVTHVVFKSGLWPSRIMLFLFP